MQHRGATSSWVYVLIFPLSPANALLQKWSTLTHLPPCGDVGESSAFLLLLTPSGWNIGWHTSTLPPSWGSGGISSVPAGLRGGKQRADSHCWGASHSVVSDSLWPHKLQLTRLLCPWDSPGTNTKVGCHSLLQGIFLTQGSNPGLLLCRQILYCLSHQKRDSLFWRDFGEGNWCPPVSLVREWAHHSAPWQGDCHLLHGTGSRWETNWSQGRSSSLPWHLVDGGWIVPNDFPALAQPSWLGGPVCSRLSVSVLAVAQGRLCSPTRMLGSSNTSPPTCQSSQVHLLVYIQGFTVVRGRLGSNGVALLWWDQK